VDSTRVKTPESPVPTKSFIWQLGPGNRGDIIHWMLGENLPHHFKTFDIYNATTRKATSIKSLDTSCMTYQNVDTISRDVKKMIDKIVNFQQASLTPKGGEKIILTSAKIDERILHLVIPKGTTNVQRQVLHSMKEYAESQNVTFKITELF
jgi:filamentous hemagglutinin